VLDGLDLALATGLPVTFVYVRHDMPLLGSPFYERRLSKQLKRARAALDEAKAAADELGVEADTDITEGDVVEEILRAAIYRDADVIVVGSRGLGMVTGAVMGSVAKTLVELSPIPVLVVKTDQAAHAAAV